MCAKLIDLSELALHLHWSYWKQDPGQCAYLETEVFKQIKKSIFKILRQQKLMETVSDAVAIK